MGKIYPPTIEYSTPYVSIVAALPCNMTREGVLLEPPLPGETDIRNKMIKFAESISDMYDKASEG